MNVYSQKTDFSFVGRVSRPMLGMQAHTHQLPFDHSLIQIQSATLAEKKEEKEKREVIGDIAGLRLNQF